MGPPSQYERTLWLYLAPATTRKMFYENFLMEVNLQERKMLQRLEQRQNLNTDIRSQDIYS